ncbi:CDF family Co(II)/Ni(II) efflux transporter DmeF [Rhodospirillaceae bacterium SYSU D60014]|uniref:CDF family Co(II)/Ni(II) efflux transporter DmeF n=1 Tax=Virgifigura deserti TaxID=2268457 RepID=UPI000E666BEE
MHTHSIDSWRHEHVFLGGDHSRNERRTWIVIALTAAMMVAEIVGGAVFGSMALMADGWHMSTHAGALAISALAYRYARRHARDPRFAFGTGKFGDLAGFSSAIILALIALLIGYESFMRFAAPVPIRFGEAIAVAVLGLAVNLMSAWLLHDGSHQGHDHHDQHDHGDHHHHHHGAARDNNLRSAYLHVIADATTSVLAILGLLAGRSYGWVWMDPLMGIVGAAVIARWSWGLMRDAGAVLIDAVPDRGLAETVRRQLEIEGDRVTDLHLWRVGPGHNAAVVALVSDHPKPPDHYKKRLAELRGLSHVTVEVQPCG